MKTYSKSLSNYPCSPWKSFSKGILPWATKSYCKKKIKNFSYGIRGLEPSPMLCIDGWAVPGKLFLPKVLSRLLWNKNETLSSFVEMVWVQQSNYKTLSLMAAPNIIKMIAESARCQALLLYYTMKSDTVDERNRGTRNFDSKWN